MKYYQTLQMYTLASTFTLLIARDRGTATMVYTLFFCESRIFTVIFNEHFFSICQY